MTAAVPGRPTLVVRDLQANLYTAIDRAVKRAAYKVRQALMQRRSLERWGRRGPDRARRDAQQDAADAVA